MTQEITILAPSDNLSGCIFAAEACIDNRKKNLLNTDTDTFLVELRFYIPLDTVGRFGYAVPGQSRL